jgi:foldase protein PrsA
MANTKKATSKAAAKSKPKKTVKAVDEITTSEMDNQPSRSIFKPSKKLLVILIILGLAALFWYKKSWLVAATVDGKPITNLELQMQLNKQFKEQALNKLINDKIFNQFEKEATDKGIVVAQADLDKNISDIENQYGGRETFDSLLSQQGITREDFTQQVKLNLLAEKFFENEIKPTEEEITKFTEDENNKLTPEATDSAKFRELAQNQIKQDKLTNKLREKFQEIKSKVVTF